MNFKKIILIRSRTDIAYHCPLVEKFKNNSIESSEPVLTLCCTTIHRYPIFSTRYSMIVQGLHWISRYK